MVLPLVLIGLAHGWIARCGSFLFVSSNLPSTVMHELAHFAVALLLGGKPSAISVWPVKRGKRWKLGSVVYRPTVLSTVPTALAPLGWLPIGGYLLLKRHALAHGSIEMLCGIYLFAYLCASASIPSPEDMQIVTSHPSSIMMWTLILCIAVYLSHLAWNTPWFA